MGLRTVVLLRHGEAEHISLDRNDHGRRLTVGGRQQIDDISRRLLEINFQAALVYCSSSRRTIETFERLPPEISHSASVKTVVPLYQATDKVLFDHLFQTDDAIESVLFVGHNPGLSDVASFLSQQHLHLGTGEAILLQADIDSWSLGGQPGNWNKIRHIHVRGDKKRSLTGIS
jgi:phosphohistidine phosphatase